MERDQRDLLVSLAYLYICCGRNWRALPMLLLVISQQPDDCESLRMLAHVYTMIRRGELALAVLDRLEEIRPVSDNAHTLLRARALHQLGRLEEARAAFACYTQALR
ncbi:tetratricopeptide repeat protein [Acetobacter thailandicus]|uniref:Type III secretion protein n=1 Tax=Acetobacter thailandicus TaxID=1502842 RepID=A0ABT3QCT7_9PROT|nr:hypothetical protein [Acetobacter thailandicus]MCX2563081.1 hypothetical protein [Acetobacter thailandicus]NHN95799.1 hypothetical protein [Acetobacter thailandicus]